MLINEAIILTDAQIASMQKVSDIANIDRYDIADKGVSTASVNASVQHRCRTDTIYDAAPVQLHRYCIVREG
jgi:hypothetical protein